MTIDADLNRIRKVRTKFHEQRPEVFVQQVEVEMVRQGCAAANPEVGLSNLGATFMNRSENSAFSGALPIYKTPSVNEVRAR